MVEKIIDLGEKKNEQALIDPKRCIVPISASCLATLLQLPPGVVILDIQMGKRIPPYNQQTIEVKVAGLGQVPGGDETIPVVSPTLHFLFGCRHWMVCWAGVNAGLEVEGGATYERKVRPDTSLEVPSGPLVVMPPEVQSPPQGSS